MANKPLKSIKFPGLTDTYTIPQIDTSLTVGGQAADAAAVGAIARVFLALGLRAGEDGRIIQRLPAEE